MKILLAAASVIVLACTASPVIAADVSEVDPSTRTQMLNAAIFWNPCSGTSTVKENDSVPTIQGAIEAKNCDIEMAGGHYRPPAMEQTIGDRFYFRNPSDPTPVAKILKEIAPVVPKAEAAPAK